MSAWVFVFSLLLLRGPMRTFAVCHLFPHSYVRFPFSKERFRETRRRCFRA